MCRSLTLTSGLCFVVVIYALVLILQAHPHLFNTYAFGEVNGWSAWLRDTLPRQIVIQLHSLDLSVAELCYISS